MKIYFLRKKGKRKPCICPNPWIGFQILKSLISTTKLRRHPCLSPYMNFIFCLLNHSASICCQNKYQPMPNKNNLYVHIYIHIVSTTLQSKGEWGCIRLLQKCIFYCITFMKVCVWMFQDPKWIKRSGMKKWKDFFFDRKCNFPQPQFLSYHVISVRSKVSYARGQIQKC